MLPNESLLFVLQFADYKTLVLAKLAATRFLRLVAKYAEELERRRDFHVIFYYDFIEYGYVTIGARPCRASIHYEFGNRPSLEASCREVAEAIGPHAVAKLVFYNNTWVMPGVNIIFDAAPPLNYAEEVDIYGQGGSTYAIFETFMSNFAGLKSLRLETDKIFSPLSWTFIRGQFARQLRFIKIAWHTFSTEDAQRSVEDLVRCCAALPRLLDGEALEVDFTGFGYEDEKNSEAFGLRIIELLKNSECELTFRMPWQGGVELTLDKSDYTVEVDGRTARYACKNSGIVVEVNGRSMTIQSTTPSPAMKRSRVVGEVLQKILFDKR